MEPRAFVQLDYGASEEDVRAVEALFSEAGTEAEVTPAVLDLSQAVYWVLIINVSLGAFVARLMQIAADDAAAALKDFVRRAHEARRLSKASDGSIQIEDRDSRVSISGLDPELADEAYRALVEIDLRTLPPGRLGWSPDRQKWVHYSREGERELG